MTLYLFTIVSGYVLLYQYISLNLAFDYNSVFSKKFEAEILVNVLRFGDLISILSIIRKLVPYQPCTHYCLAELLWGKLLDTHASFPSI